MLIQELRQAKILIVDDDESNAQLLQDVLRWDGYSQVHAISDPRGVLRLTIEFRPDLILLDLNMPYISGYQLLDMILPTVGETEYLPVLVVSAEGTYDARRRALTHGASDFLVKPYIPDEVRVRVNNMLRLRFINHHLQDQARTLEEEVQNRTRELEDYQIELKRAHLEIIARLARAAEHRDDETGYHTQRVGFTCGLLAQSLGLAEQQVQLLYQAAPLHDVGKIGIPDSILLKPGPFTDAERAIMQRHCEIGSELLAEGKSEIVQMAERIALTHHEWWNGQGYPHRLSGDDIPVEGRILTVVDVFDALTHARPYKKAWSVGDALAELQRLSGQQFDPQIVEAFMKLPHEKLI